MTGQAKWVRVSWMAGALLPLLVGLTGAANLNSTAPHTNQPMQDDQQVATPSEPTAQFRPHLEKAGDFLGAKVFNERGEELGAIADVVLTPDRGGINYVVLAHGGVWGVADKYFAVPWAQFGFRPGEDGKKTYVLKGNISKADLDRAPGFDKDNWPAVASENWLGIERGSAMVPSGSAPMPAPADEGVAAAPQSSPDRGMRGDTAYGTAPAKDIQSLRLSKLLGTAIHNLQDEDLGKLDNVMIDVHHGKVAYGIVAMRHGFLGLDRDFVAVPWSALDWTAQAGIARLDADRDTLLALAFEGDNFPNLEDLQYSRQLHERFGVTPYWEGQALGFLPGEKKENGKLPSSEMTSPNSGSVPPNSGTVPPDSGMMAPNAAPNSGAPRMIHNKDCPGHKHKDKDASAYRYNYNPNAVQTFHGTISRVTTHRIGDTDMQHVRLTVRADSGQTVFVDVGPRSFVDRQNINFREGDSVMVTGSLVKTSGRDVYVASQIQTPNRTLNLRTREGAPLWDREQARASGPYDRDYGRYQYPYRY